MPTNAAWPASSNPGRFLSFTYKKSSIMKRYAIWMMALLMAMTLNLARAADVLLGPGDVLKVSVYNNPDLQLETRVSAAGGITFPLIGPVTVGGLTVAAAEKKISDLLGGGGFLKKAGGK